MNRRPDRGEIFVGKSGDFYARRKAPNGEIIATSEGYVDKRSAVLWLTRQGLAVSARRFEDATHEGPSSTEQ